MIITATQKNTRQTPRKVRLVANTVKNLPLDQAIRQLAIIERRATMPVLKVLKQAIANALNNHGLKFEELELNSITVNEGTRQRRYRAASKGRAHDIKKRSSHITVSLKTREAKEATAEKAVADKKEVVSAAAPSVEAKKPVKKTTAKKVTKSTK
ncbi:MAG: 50S ribosomal protein L22 [bacterium]|nr:50S ribosomal protein L22 [bacterium]